MQKLLKIGALVSAACAFMPFMANAQPLPAQAAPSANDIVLGSSLPLSGQSEILGRELQSGAHAYFDRVNSSGGVDGHRIRLIDRDDRYEPQQTVANTTKFIKDDHVLAMINYVGTATTAAALPQLTAAGIPLVGAFTGAKSLRDPGNRTIFHTRASYADEGVPLAEQLANYGNVALFVQDDAYGDAVREAVTLGLAKSGRKPAVITTIKRNATGAEMQAAINKAADAIAASGAGAVAVGSVYTPVGALSKALHDRAAPVVIGSVSFISPSGVVQTMKKAGAGITIMAVVPNPLVGNSELARDYQRDIAAWHEHLLAMAKSATNKDEALELNTQAQYAVPTYEGMEGYINARVMFEGLRACHGKLASDNLRVAIEGLGKIDLGGFTETFSRTSHIGSTWTDRTVVSNDGTRIIE